VQVINYVDTTKLKQCKLYPTSIIGLDEKYLGKLSFRSLCKYYETKVKLDDKTPDEIEFINAIKETILNHKISPL
jgi:hypothetical protein